MTPELKLEARRRLARIEGQVQGIQRMVEDDRTCSEILQQVVAARAAMETLGVSFLSEHLQTCVLHEGIHGGDGSCLDLPPEQRTEEIKSSIRRYLK